MSNTLPAAPPPPPPNVLRCASNKTNSVQIRTVPQKPALDECLWSVEYPELQKACFLARVCLNRRPSSCRFFNIDSILQVGPTCGLTALSMLLGGTPSADRLLSDAKERNFSYNGEMFSAQQLYQLVCDYLPTMNAMHGNDLQRQLNGNDTDTENPPLRNIALNREHLECLMHEGHINCATVREALLHKSCMFVPYPF